MPMFSKIIIGNMELEVSGSQSEVLDVVKQLDLYVEDIMSEYEQTDQERIIVNMFEMKPFQIYRPPQYEEQIQSIFGLRLDKNSDEDMFISDY